MELHLDDQQVIEALASIPGPQRRALVLHAIAGLTVAEIAAELSAPPGTVKSWLSRGRERLARELSAAAQEAGR